ncbi:MAG TPA: hypothetical protein DEF79_13215 [Gammaproteobacteria bacterium]|nr:hypothetical protein [Gammaproteobacteria bacterium]
MQHESLRIQRCRKIAVVAGAKSAFQDDRQAALGSSLSILFTHELQRAAILVISPKSASDS